MSGLWTSTQARININILELWAVHLAFLWVIPKVRCRTIRGTKSFSLCKQTVRLFIWWTPHQIILIAEHIPGVDNTLADLLSCKTTLNLKPQRQGLRGTSGSGVVSPPGGLPLYIQPTGSFPCRSVCVSDILSTF